MVQHARLIFYSLLLLVIPCESTLAQKIPVTPIDSLITVGYATGSLKNLSGSVEKITETQMNKDQITNPLEAIRGRVPGLTIQRGSNGPAALDAVRLRGTTSLTSGNDPLIIVDGVFGDLSMLTSIYPTDIESFTILKDASETAQYGSRGASGVIEVTTKKGMSGRTQVAYNGSFGVSTVYKNSVVWLRSVAFPFWTKEITPIFRKRLNRQDCNKTITSPFMVVPVNPAIVFPSVSWTVRE